MFNKERIQAHLKKYKYWYISGASLALAGGAYYLGTRVSPSQVAITNPALVNYKPTSNIVQVQMSRPGPKAHVIQCLETQEVFPSIRQAAESMSLNKNDIMKLLKGEIDTVKGFTFRKLDEI